MYGQKHQLDDVLGWECVALLCWFFYSCGFWDLQSFASFFSFDKKLTAASKSSSLFHIASTSLAMFTW